MRHPFDLATEIPLRARLFRVADDEHVLVAVVHHIAADGWSIAPLVRDLGWPTSAGAWGKPPAGRRLPVQYVDYTLWQRAQLGDLDDSDSRIAAQLAYWEDALAGMPERLQLPTDRPYPPVADHRGASVAVDWPAELQQRIARVAREHNATSFMVVQAALAVLLAKLSASTDVAVGFPIAGRRDPALDELVGFFVNTLVLRVDLAGDPTCRRAAGPGATAQPGRLRAPGRALRGAGGAAQPDPSADPSPAGPGDVGLAEPARAGQRPRRRAGLG